MAGQGTVGLEILEQATAPVRRIVMPCGGGGLASGIALTSFMRRPEYGGTKEWSEDGQPAEVGKRRGPVGLALNTFEWAARVVVHYPQYLWLVAAVNRIDIYFWAYAAVNVLYFGMSMLKIFVKLGRFSS